MNKIYMLRVLRVANNNLYCNNPYYTHYYHSISAAILDAGFRADDANYVQILHRFYNLCMNTGYAIVFVYHHTYNTITRLVLRNTVMP